MKPKTFFILIWNLLICFACGELQSQNITNTLGALGVFKIKDGTTDYLTLNQTTGQVNILKTLRLEKTTSSTTGVIYVGAERFMHNYGFDNIFLGSGSGNFTTTGAANSVFGLFSLYSNTSGSNNSAFGYLSLSSNTTGYENSAFGYQSLNFNTTGYWNSAFGVNSLRLNTTGYNNSAFGSYSLYSNTTGYWNSAFGVNSLRFNTTGIYNSAFGYQSLFSNITGISNSAFGYYSLFYNTGNANSAFGYSSLLNNTTGINNSAFGYHSLYFNNTGSNNSAFGPTALFFNTTGSYNTAIGHESGYLISSGSNNTALGYSAQVPSGTSSNQVRVGNTFVTYAGLQVAWTITSDRKWKENIITSPLGLNFINKLNPVSYTRINDESGKTEYGLIAQELEEVLKEEGIENSAMITVTDEGNYELRYNDLLAPMVKAIQELKTENDKLKAEIENMRSIEERLVKLELSQIQQNSTKEIKLSVE